MWWYAVAAFVLVTVTMTADRFSSSFAAEIRDNDRLKLEVCENLGRLLWRPWSRQILP